MSDTKKSLGYSTPTTVSIMRPGTEMKGTACQQGNPKPPTDFIISDNASKNCHPDILEGDQYESAAIRVDTEKFTVAFTVRSRYDVVDVSDNVSCSKVLGMVDDSTT